MPPSTARVATYAKHGRAHRPTTVERLNGLLAELDPARFDELRSHVARTAEALGAWKEHDGARRAVPVEVRPRLIRVARRGWVHHVAWQLRLGLTRLGRLFREVAEIAELLPLEPLEARWLRAYGHPGMRERLFCRLDAIGSFDQHGWQRSLCFLEPNVTGIGGTRYTAAAEEALLQHVAPLAARIDPELAFARNDDPRTLLMSELVAHARELGATGSPRVVLLDDQSLYTMGGEMAELAEWMRAQGCDAVAADPRALELAADGSVVHDGRRVDVVYRYLELRELTAMEEAGDDLSGLRRAFETQRVVPGATGDLEHKSAFEVMTDPRFEPLFTPVQRRMFREHVLWTRLLCDRRATDPDGRHVSLPDWTRAHRTRLVIKPNRSFGGDRVVIGHDVDEATWSAAIHEALREPGSHVVQLACAPQVERFPVLAGGSVRLEERYTTVGLYPSANGLGLFGRVGTGRVVNLCTGGSVSPFLVEVR